MKTYVIDTSELISNPDIMYSLGTNIIDIPAPVIRELDGLKRSEKENVATAARQVARLLDRLGSYGDLSKGVPLSSTGLVRVSTICKRVEGLASERDNKIVGTALALKNRGEDVTLYTGDTNMRTIARANGVKAEMFGGDYVLPSNQVSASAEKIVSRSQSTISSHNGSAPWLYRLKIIVIAIMIIVGALAAWRYTLGVRALSKQTKLTEEIRQNREHLKAAFLKKGQRRLAKELMKNRMVIPAIVDVQEEIYTHEAPYAYGSAAVVGLFAVILAFRKKRVSRKVSLNTDSIKEVIIGQDDVIEEIIKTLSATSTSATRGKRPRFVGMITGPSGVGKTEFVKVLSQFTGLPLHIFNMADYMGDSTREASASHWRLFGSATGYADGDVQGEFIAAIAKDPNSILLLDEIEKVNKKVLDTFLTAFQEGVVKSNRGEEYSLKGAFIFCTSNMCHTTPPGTSEKDLRKVLAEEGLRTEFIGRLDKVALFSPITIGAARVILENEIRKRFKGEVVMEDAPTLLLLQKYGFEEAGVRAIQRLITEEGLENIPAEVKKVLITDIADGGAGIKCITISSFTNDDIVSLKQLPEKLHANVLGQNHAIEAVVNKLKANAIGATLKPNRPLGVFLFVGPTGVGKTELARTIADATGRAFTQFDMSEFKESESAQRFFGPPPGYTGSDRGGQLTQEVLRKPASVILLDECEKANPQIWDTFLSIFDCGIMKDASTGTPVSFKNTIILMTSNIAIEDRSEVKASVLETGYFRPEFINRLDDIVLFCHFQKIA